MTFFRQWQPMVVWSLAALSLSARGLAQQPSAAANGEDARHRQAIEVQQVQIADENRQRPAIGVEPFPGAWAAPAGMSLALSPRRPNQAELDAAENAQRQGEKNSAGSTSIGEFLAVGQKSLGVVFYSFKDGRTKGIFAANVVVRESEQLLEINHLEAQLAANGDDGPMSWIAVDEASWYLPLAQLYSEQTTEMRRTNLRVVGEGCTYHQTTGVIEIHGNTHTWIHPSQNAPLNQPTSSVLSPKTR